MGGALCLTRLEGCKFCGSEKKPELSPLFHPWAAAATPRPCGLLGNMRRSSAAECRLNLCLGILSANFVPFQFQMSENQCRKNFSFAAYIISDTEKGRACALRTFQEDYFRLMELKSFARPAAMILSIQRRGDGWMGIQATLFHSALRRRAVRKGRRTGIWIS